MNCPKCNERLQYQTANIPDQVHLPGVVYQSSLDGNITWCGSCGVILIWDSSIDHDSVMQTARLLHPDEIQELQTKAPDFYNRVVEISLVIIQDNNK